MNRQDTFPRPAQRAISRISSDFCLRRPPEKPILSFRGIFVLHSGCFVRMSALASPAHSMQVHAFSLFNYCRLCVCTGCLLHRLPAVDMNAVCMPVFWPLSANHLFAPVASFTACQFTKERFFSDMRPPQHTHTRVHPSAHQCTQKPETPSQAAFTMNASTTAVPYQKQAMHTRLAMTNVIQTLMCTPPMISSQA